ncbi:MAG: type IV toxin-antitoxin system AbiEi family antitoxin [Candidatus Coatesbacteria bacterium]
MQLSKTPGLLTVTDGARILGLGHAETRRLLAGLASRGWLTRVSHGLYAPTPLDADRPADWHVDPWVLAHHLFAPCYIGGWSACEHWGLTEQVFRDIVVMTARHIRSRHPVIQGTGFVLTTRPERLLFGTRWVWRGRVRVRVSDPSRTIADIVADPALAGGVRHTSDVLLAYCRSQHKDYALLLDYCQRLDNRTAYKRLGYLVERLAINAPELIQACRQRLSAGYSLLDTTIKGRGRIVRRWNLRVNVVFSDQGEPS